MLVDVQLDASQREVAEAESDARMFVTAAAGQGKTEVLLARVQTLVEDGLNPADEILVLSFSRAAVEAVRKRARVHDLDGLQIRTFDSFAAQILIDMDEEALGGSFDARIRKATEHIAGEETPDRITYLKHIMVDEAQDLVGDRAELVKSLFSAIGDELGVTVLGDPLQGIYDFQLDESESKLSSNEFIQWLIDDFGAQHETLEHHYRAETDRTRELISVGDEIRTLTPSMKPTLRRRTDFSTIFACRCAVPPCSTSPAPLVRTVLAPRLSFVQLTTKSLLPANFSGETAIPT